MGPEDKMEIARIISEFDNALKDFQEQLTFIINGLSSPSEFPQILKNWEEKRQILNNLGIGILIYFGQIKLETFLLRGNLTSDLGQKKLDSQTFLSPGQINKLDKKFLGSIHVQHDEDPDKL